MCKTFQNTLNSVQIELDELGLLVKHLEKENEILIECNWCKLEQIEKLELKLQSEMFKQENIDALEERITSKECELGAMQENVQHLNLQLKDMTVKCYNAKLEMEVMASELEAENRENQELLEDKQAALERIKVLEKVVKENERNERHTKHSMEQSFENKQREKLHLLRDNQRALKRYLKRFESEIRANLEEMKGQLDESEKITTAIETINKNK